MEELCIKGLSAEAEGKKILKGVDLTVRKGDVIALLGPNGHGKSTLLNCLLGSPHYAVTSGTALLDGEDILPLSTDAHPAASSSAESAANADGASDRSTNPTTGP